MPWSTIMDFIFGTKPSPEEVCRKNQRALNHAQREIEREHAHLMQREKQIIKEIHKLAKDKQVDALKVLAKDLTHSRAHAKKFMIMRTQIQAVSLQIQTVKSQAAMTNAMQNVSRIMYRMNRVMNLPQLKRMLANFEMQAEVLELKQEEIDESMDDVMEMDSDEEDADAICAKVLDELGLQMTDALCQLPNISETSPGNEGKNSDSNQPSEISAGNSNQIKDADLQARLNKLRHL